MISVLLSLLISDDFIVSTMVLVTVLMEAIYHMQDKKGFKAKESWARETLTTELLYLILIW